MSPQIYVDADACPVKPEVFRVAERHGLMVFVVSNSFINLPRESWIRPVQVSEGPDIADDWIIAQAQAGDIIVTADVPLAARGVKLGACVLSPQGKLFDEASIGMALATRNLMTDLRSAGEITSGPRPFSPRDRSAFLQALHEAIVRRQRIIRD